MASTAKDNQLKNTTLPSPEQIETELRRLRREKHFRSVLGSTVVLLLVVAAMATLLVTLFLPVLQVTGVSMEPTLNDGDIIVLLKTSSLDIGDLCAVRVAGNVLLKRVIAGPGDWVDIDEKGDVYVNGELLDEPYVTNKALGITDLTYPCRVPDNAIFVMGDHRSISVDSRSSEVGYISYEQIIGRAIIRVWPLSRISYL